LFFNQCMERMRILVRQFSRIAELDGRKAAARDMSPESIPPSPPLGKTDVVAVFFSNMLL